MKKKGRDEKEGPRREYKSNGGEGGGIMEEN